MARRSISAAKRLRIFTRDGYACRDCGTTEGNFEVDHVEERRAGGSDDDDNLQTLCEACHKRKTALYAKARSIARKHRPRVEGPTTIPYYGEPPKARKIPHPEKTNWASRKIPSRPFPKRR